MEASACSFLYDYLAWFKRTSEVLGPPEGDDDRHLAGLADVLMSYAVKKEPGPKSREKVEELLVKLADEVTDGSCLDALQNFFADALCDTEEQMKEFRENLRKSPGRAVSARKLQKSEGA